MDRSRRTLKSFEIRKRLVFEAWENGPSVRFYRAERGFACEQTISHPDEVDNLYKLWNPDSGS